MTQGPRIFPGSLVWEKHMGLSVPVPSRNSSLLDAAQFLGVGWPTSQPPNNEALACGDIGKSLN